MAGVLSVFGDKLYQRRARTALPILVRQALAGEPLTYGALAGELGMPNARNLNFVLGAIGTELARLSKTRKASIPPIQTLVVNAASGVPGVGVYGFLEEDGRRLTLREKRHLIRAKHQQVFGYGRWPEVLANLGLEGVPSQISGERLGRIASPRGGEGAAHRALKEFVGANPHMIGIRPLSTEVECRLASADCVDVVFRTTELCLAVEVKAADASQDEVIRGLFQCVKYRAVLKGMNDYQSQNVDTDAVLVLGGKLPLELTALRNTLGVRVVEGIGRRLRT